MELEQIQVAREQKADRKERRKRRLLGPFRFLKDLAS